MGLLHRVFPSTWGHKKVHYYMSNGMYFVLMRLVFSCLISIEENDNIAAHWQYKEKGSAIDLFLCLY